MSPALAKRFAAVVVVAGCFGMARAAPDMQQVPIIDPVLTMPAWTLAAPAGWRVDGTMLPGTSCVNATTPVFRAVSPDGKAGVYFLPRVDWAWGSAARPGPDCLPLSKAVSAEEYLTNLIHSLGVGYVRKEPVPELDAKRIDAAAQDRQTYGMRKTTVDSARFLVRYDVAGVPYEEWTTATVYCYDATMAAIGHQYSCSAYASRWYAPLGTLAGAIPAMRAIKLAVNSQWMSQWTRLMAARFQNRTKQQTAALLQQGNLAQASRTRQQAVYMDSVKQGADLEKQRFQEHLFQKQHQADNFVDYVADCQRLYSASSRVSVGNNCPNRQTY